MHCQTLRGELRKKGMGKVLFLMLMCLCLLLAGGCRQLKKEPVQEETQEEKNKKDYEKAMGYLDGKEYKQAHDLFKKLGDYNDSAAKAQESGYCLANELMEKLDYEHAGQYFSALGNYKDSAKCFLQCRMLHIIDLINANKYSEAETQIASLASDKYTPKLKTLCEYQKGVYYYKKGKYTASAKLLLKMPKYEDSSKYLIRAAKKLVKKKKYTVPYKICKTLSGQKGIKKLENKIILAQKYAKYNMNAPMDISIDSTAMTKEQVEQFLQEHFYGGWVENETGEEFLMDKYRRNNRPYGIYCMKEDIGWYYVIYYYLDDPKKMYSEAWHEVSVPTQGVSEPMIEGNSMPNCVESDYCYAKMTEEEMYAFAEEGRKRWEEEEKAEAEKAAAASQNNSNDDDSVSESEQNAAIQCAMAFLPQAIQKKFALFADEPHKLLSIKKVSKWFGCYRVDVEVKLLEQHSTRTFGILVRKGYFDDWSFQGVI